MIQPLGSFDISPFYIVHDVVYFAHDHPTEPDTFNAAVKAIETALKALQFPDVNGVQLLNVALQNIDHDGSGNITVSVDTLENVVNLGSVQLRDNGGALEISTDGGSTWTGNSGDLNFIEGSNITIDHTGNDVTISATGGSTGESLLDVLATDPAADPDKVKLYAVGPLNESDAGTQLLIHSDSTEGNTLIEDSSSFARAISAYRDDPIHTTAWYGIPATSIRFDGNHPLGISMPAFGTGDLTIAFYIRHDTFNNQKNVIDGGVNIKIVWGATTWGFTFGSSSLGNVRLTPNVGAHIAIVREGGTLYGYKNGQQIESVSNSDNINAAQWNIGGDVDSIVGNLDEIVVLNYAQHVFPQRPEVRYRNPDGSIFRLEGVAL